MRNVTDTPVLVLNRFWQAVNIMRAQKAIEKLIVGRVTALNFDESSSGIPAKWDDWVTLPVRPGDEAFRSQRMAIRVPSVVIATEFEDIPKTSPTVSSRAVGERDGYVCQYTGKYDPNGNMDHVDPRKRGGKTTWRNCVWASKEVNSKKGSKSLQEAGLKLLRTPKEPARIPAVIKKIRRFKNIPKDWLPFIPGHK